MPKLLVHFFGNSRWFQRQWVLLYAVLGAGPLAFFKNISDFTWNSFLCTLTLGGFSILLFIRCVVDRVPPPDPSYVNGVDFASLNLYSAIGGVSYLFVCHDLSFSVFGEFKGANRSRWRGVAASAMIFVELFFLFTAFSGYFLFYGDTQANVLDNFPNDDVLAITARILVTITIILCVPYNVYMPRMSLYALSTLIFGPKLNHKRFHIISTTFVLLLALGTSELVTDLGATYEIVGGVSAVGLAFIIPPLLYLRLERGHILKSPKKFLNFVVFVFGILASFGSTLTSILGIFYPDS